MCVVICVCVCVWCMFVCVCVSVCVHVCAHALQILCLGALLLKLCFGESGGVCISSVYGS